jgi:hypothetical protein
VAAHLRMIVVRDSTAPTDPVLGFTRARSELVVPQEIRAAWEPLIEEVLSDDRVTGQRTD